MHTCIPAITIRDVPDDTRDQLAERAAASGRSRQQCLRAELIRLAERPDNMATAPVNDPALDEALAALLARDRAAEIDAAYSEHPLDEADGWGDLASFRRAAGQ